MTCLIGGQNPISTGGLLLLSGPMGAGKSSHLLSLYFQEQATGVACFMIRIGQVNSLNVTHDRIAVPVDLIIPVGGDLDLDAIQFANPGAVFIDEVQFLNATTAMRDIQFLLTKHVRVYATCLSGDFRQEPWELFGNLCAIADVHIPLYARCSHCNHRAAFTVKVQGTCDRIELETGSMVMYEPRCRECLFIE